MNAKSEQKIITLVDFDKNLTQMNPSEALNLVKQLIDKATSGGMFKTVDSAAQFYQALKVLDNIVHPPALPVTDQAQEKKDKE